MSDLPFQPRYAAFAGKFGRICDLYTRPLEAHERVICADEHTSIQRRPRLSLTRPVLPDCPTTVEREYRRCGALNLLGALDTRTGRCGERSVSANGRLSSWRCLPASTPTYGRQ
jgi:hypothetical protein